MIIRRTIQDWLPHQLEYPQLQKLLKVGIVIVALMLSLFEAINPRPRNTLIILGLLVAMVGLIFLLRKPILGIIGVILAAMFFPALLSGGAGNLLSAPIILLVLTITIWLVDMLVRQRKIRFLRSRVVLAAFVFLIVSIIAFLNGQINYYSFAQVAPITAQIGGFAVFFLSMGALLVSAHLIKDIKWLETITWLYLVIGGIYIIFGRVITYTEPYIRSRFAFGSTDSASAFWIWLAAMAFSQALFNRRLDKRIRLVLLGLVVAEMYVGIVQAYDWKSGWLPAVIAILTILWIGIPRIRIPGAVVAVAAIVLNQFTKIGSVITRNEDYSILTREVAQRLVLEIAKVNPVLGLGFSNYYWYTRLFPILGYRVQFNSHNNYVDIIAQSGLVGLACFLWLAFEVGLVGWNLEKKVPDGFARAYVLGVLGGLVGTLASGILGDWILPFVYNVGLNGFRASMMAWLFIGGMIALEGMYTASLASTDAGEPPD
jgi:hypothetical protein